MLQDTEPAAGMSRKGANPGRPRLVKILEVRGSGSFRIFCFPASVAIGVPGFVLRFYFFPKLLFPRMIWRR